MEIRNIIDPNTEAGLQLAWNTPQDERTKKQKLAVTKESQKLAQIRRESMAHETSIQEIQTYVRQAAIASGTQAAWLAKAFKPAKNKIIHCGQLDLWQALHDALDDMPTLRKYARRMEQYGNALLGYAQAWDIDGNPIPHDDRADDILIWTKPKNGCPGKFSLARHAKEELAYLRKHTRHTSLTAFKLGKPEKTGREAKADQIRARAVKVGKALASTINALTKVDNGDTIALMISDIMFAIAKTPASICTPYVQHIINAHCAAVTAKLANQFTAALADMPNRIKAAAEAEAEAEA